MRWPRSWAALALACLSASALAALQGCQDSGPTLEPDPAVTVVRKTLTVTGTGSGSGLVTSSPAGIACTITAGRAAATGCIASFVKGTVVNLTATPVAGHAFVEWLQFCRGAGVCQATMSADRAVRARFLKGPFTIRISGAAVGGGSGTVQTQTGLTPAIACAITDGVPATTGCSAVYPAGTELSLTATPGSGFSVAALASPCPATDTCQLIAVQPVAITATFSNGGSDAAATTGRWAPMFPTPIVAIHMHLLPTGMVLLWGDKGQGQLWDWRRPAAGFTPLTKAYRIFCSGHTLLPDGRLFVAGGHISNDRGLALATILDPSSGTWTATPPMRQGRWYPTTTVLADGEVLVVAGADSNGLMVKVPEVWNGSGWRRLTGAPLELPYYPDMFAAPNGRVFYAGPGATTRYLDVRGAGTWTTVGDRIVPDRDYGSAVMYAPGKILYAGGGDPPTASAEVIDLNQPAPAWRSVAGMAFARRQMLATLLADGSVLVSQGTSGAGFNNVTAAVHAAELWNPATETWTTMAAETSRRVYHSTAVLLPDGRVLSSGSGEGAGIPFDASQLSAQVFSPPYLFAADGSPAVRPVITTAPARVTYAQTFAVETPDAGAVLRGTLIRLSSVTHAFNQSQLGYPVTFQATGPTTLQADGPANANLAPPGPYLLFLLGPSGTPSIGAIVTVGP